MIILGLDPSVNNVGLALLNSDTGDCQTWTFHPKRTKETPMTQVGAQLARFIFLSVLQGKIRPDLVVAEYPQWEGSERGLIAAQQGYTLDLAFIVGYAVATLGLVPTKIMTPTPMEWKGNMPKTAVKARFEKYFEISADGISDHEYEAAMMAVWGLAETKKA